MEEARSVLRQLHSLSNHDKLSEDDKRKQALLLKKLLLRLHDAVNQDTALLDASVAAVKFRKTPSRPQFPLSVNIKEIRPIGFSHLHFFKKRHIDHTVIPDLEAQSRIGGGVQHVRDLQYRRWQWCMEHMPMYINMLRLSGFKDDAIQAMLNGRPLCIPSDGVWEELRYSLAGLVPQLKRDTKWTNIGFVVTGSSVVGFSQNPLKGRADEPTYTMSADKTTVAICVRAQGVTRSINRLNRTYPYTSRAIESHVATGGPTTGGIRYGNIPDSMLTSIAASLADWVRDWKDALHPGGLILTLSEDSWEIPPWEARINVEPILEKMAALDNATEEHNDDDTSVSEIFYEEQLDDESVATQVA